MRQFFDEEAQHLKLAANEVISSHPNEVRTISIHVYYSKLHEDFSNAHGLFS